MMKKTRKTGGRANREAAFVAADAALSWFEVCADALRSGLNDLVHPSPRDIDAHLGRLLAAKDANAEERERKRWARKHPETERAIHDKVDRDGAVRGLLDGRPARLAELVLAGKLTPDEAMRRLLRTRRRSVADAVAYAPGRDRVPA